MTEVLLHKNLWHIRVNKNEHLGDVNSTLPRLHKNFGNPTASGLYPMKDGLALVVAVESIPAIPEIPNYGSGRTTINFAELLHTRGAMISSMYLSAIYRVQIAGL